MPIPFWRGNGRSTRVWLDAILKRELGMVVDWSRVDRVDDREVFMHGVDSSFRYEGYDRYRTDEV